MREWFENRITITLLAAMLMLLIWPVVLAEDVTSPLGDQAEDVGDSFQQTLDGGFIVVATNETSAPDGNDVWLIKADADGNEAWRKAFSFGPGEDGGASVQQTLDGGYIIAGYTDSMSDTYDVLLMKTDADGVELWRKTFSLGDSNDIGSDVRETDDGGFVIVGRTGSMNTGGSDVLLLKTDSEGNELWSRTSSFGMGEDIGVSVQQSKDGGYIVAGYTNSTGSSYDVLLLKADAEGNEIWNRTFSLGAGNDIGGDVVETDDGYIIAGRTGSMETGGKDVMVIKADMQGNEVWNKTFSLGTGEEGGSSIAQSGDGGFILAGFTGSADPDSYDVLLLKVDENGDEQWQRTFSIGEEHDIGGDVVAAEDGYIVAGLTNSTSNGGSGILLIKTDLEGEEQWRKTFEGGE